MQNKRRVFREPPEAKFILAMMWQSKFDIETFITNEILPEFGEIELRSGAFDFTHSNYYSTEMGTELKKEFLAFKTLVPRTQLIDLKHRTFNLEEKYLQDNEFKGTEASAQKLKNRIVNLDPMILNIENLIIATSKSFPHRVYLGDGVYGDLALIRRVVNKVSRYDKLPWTYADYWEYCDFFEKVRQKL